MALEIPGAELDITLRHHGGQDRSVYPDIQVLERLGLPEGLDDTDEQ